MKKIALPRGTLIEVTHEAFYFLAKDESYAASSGTDTSTSTLLSATTPDPLSVGEYKVIPEGISNNIHSYLRGLLDGNHLDGSVLDKIIGLILAQGIAQYTEKIIDNQITRQWAEDPQVTEWLRLWDHKVMRRGFIKEIVLNFVLFNSAKKNRTRYILATIF